MIRSNASAVRTMSQPWLVSGVEKPKPGIDGTTTWNAGAGPTPEVDARAFGELGAMPANSTNDDGYPWHEQQRDACSCVRSARAGRGSAGRRRRRGTAAGG